MSLRTCERIGGLARSALCLAVLSLATPALAQIIPTPVIQECGSTTPGGSGNLCSVSAGPAYVSTGDTCGFARGATGCTANDFVGQANVTSNTLTNCHIGDPLINQSLSFQITSSSSVRYSPGLFIGEQNQDLSVAGGTCSVATFPPTNDLGVQPFPWLGVNVGNACGSYSPNFTSLQEIQGVNFACDPDANGNLQITFMIVYANNAAGSTLCTGPGNVAPGTSSKCSSGGTAVTNVVVTYNANPSCVGTSTLVYDPVAGTVTATFTITNSGPDSAGPLAGGNVTFEDVIPPPVVVTSALCGNALGGAVCGTVGNVGNDVTGTIDTLPVGGSVDITIVGTVAGGLTDVLNNTPTLSVNGTVVTVPGGWLNTCPATTTLPVRLQDFDVK